MFSLEDFSRRGILLQKHQILVKERSLLALLVRSLIRLLLGVVKNFIL